MPTYIVCGLVARFDSLGAITHPSSPAAASAATPSGLPVGSMNGCASVNLTRLLTQPRVSRPPCTAQARKLRCSPQAITQSTRILGDVCAILPWRYPSQVLQPPHLCGSPFRTQVGSRDGNRVPLLAIEDRGCQRALCCPRQLCGCLITLIAKPYWAVLKPAARAGNAPIMQRLRRIVLALFSGHHSLWERRGRCTEQQAGSQLLAAAPAARLHGT
jgi:hypothetical protein